MSRELIDRQAVALSVIVQYARAALDGTLDELSIGSDAEAWELVLIEAEAVTADA
jgi:hypothetical protein